MSEFIIGYHAIRNAAQYKQAIQRKNAELRDLRAANEQLHGAIEQLQTAVANLQSQNGQLAAQRDSLRQELSGTMKTLAAERAKASQLERSLEESRSHAEMAIQELAVALQRLEEKG